MKFDEGLFNYIEAHTTSEDDVLSRLYRETHLKALYPRMLSGHFQGRFLELISKIIHPEYVLEIGTFTGYSAICMARGLGRGGKLHTIERNDEITGFAEKYFEIAGMRDKIVLHAGDALQIIPKLSMKFDMVFIDGDKNEYLEYYRLIFDKVKPGGIILADNVLWDGKVFDESVKTDKETQSLRQFNTTIMQDDRVENILLPFRDGLMMMQKRNDTGS